MGASAASDRGRPAQRQTVAVAQAGPAPLPCSQGLRSVCLAPTPVLQSCQSRAHCLKPLDPRGCGPFLSASHMAEEFHQGERCDVQFTVLIKDAYHKPGWQVLLPSNSYCARPSLKGHHCAL